MMRPHEWLKARTALAAIDWILVARPNPISLAVGFSCRLDILLGRYTLETSFFTESHEDERKIETKGQPYSGRNSRRHQAVQVLKSATPRRPWVGSGVLQRIRLRRISFHLSARAIWGADKKNPI